MSKHTPGPWLVTNASWDEEGNVRYTLLGIKLVKNADARLIEYAPNFFEALQSIVECCDETNLDRDYISRQTEIRGIALSLIDKATGVAE